MTSIRTGSKLGTPKQDTKPAPDGQSKNIDKKVCNEIVDKVFGFVNTSSGSPEAVRSNHQMKLHLVLKKLMKNNNESVRAASKATGIPLSTLSGYLKESKKQVDPSHLISLAKHYKVSLNYLFGIEEQVKLSDMPTKKLFSRIVKLTIEDLEDLEEEK